MGFKAEVKRFNLQGIDRKIKAAENDLARAQWAENNAEKPVRAQQANLEKCRDVYFEALGRVEALRKQKEFEESSN